MSSIDELLTLCETRISYQFRDRLLLRRCLTHSSSAETRLDSNERLEFLGDAVLGIIICEHLFQMFPDQREGQLTQMKSYLVSRQTCARVARLLEMETLIIVGRGLQNIPESILSAVIESLIAGIYFDGGLEAARQFIMHAFREELPLCRPIDTDNFKSQLQEYTQRELGKTPEYVLLEEIGPDHAREFSIAARVGSDVFEAGRGRSKKEAEQRAARHAVVALLQVEVPEAGSVPEEDESTVFPGTETDAMAPSEAGPPTSVKIVAPVNEFEDPFGFGCDLVETEVLFRPGTDALRFLPEGPCSLGDGRVSWVGIQHGADSTTGSINILNLSSRTNQSFALPGRPGFAFPTDRPGVFVTGVERSVGLFDTANGQWAPFIENVDSAVTNTIINDAVVFEQNLIFGCKELEFRTKKAGLYLWRRHDGATLQLRHDQICSNGKAIIRNSDGSLTLFDIDSCTKQIISCDLDLENGTVGTQTVVVDLTFENVFPDGMILTPDHKSLIVALYNPGDPHSGAARQYRIADGQLETIWTCAGSPRVTCPQLVEHEGRVRLLLTSAVENMPAEQLAKHPNAGCLFIGDTSFRSIGDQPVFQCP